MRRDGGSVFPAHASTGDPNGPRGLSANEIARALISMMAGSTSSNQRPNILMQDRKPADRLNSLATHGRTIYSGHEHACRGFSIVRRLNPQLRTDASTIGTAASCRHFCAIDRVKLICRRHPRGKEESRRCQSWNEHCTANPVSLIFARAPANSHIRFILVQTLVGSSTCSLIRLFEPAHSPLSVPGLF
jgi:hypothetical protein